jgi:hypothetical protein
MDGPLPYATRIDPRNKATPHGVVAALIAG